MYAYIKGTLTHLETHLAIIETHGIGYAISIPLSTYSNLLPSLHKDTLLYLSPVYREDNQLLFGFHDQNDRQLFEKIRDVSGIGPKTALAIIGHLDSEALSWAITSQDIASLSKVPGIGKKTAQRLIVELQGKLPKTTSTPSTGLSQDAIAALIQLGYSLDKAQKAVSKALAKTSEKPDLSDLITSALQHV